MISPWNPVGDPYELLFHVEDVGEENYRTLLTSFANRTGRPWPKTTQVRTRTERIESLDPIDGKMTCAPKEALAPKQSHPEKRLSSNKKLVGTSASLLVTSALLVVTRS